MTYRIKVIEYESGRKEYVPQVRRRWWDSWNCIWNGSDWIIWDRVFICHTIEDADKAIVEHKSNRLKSVTYKHVQP